MLIGVISDTHGYVDPRLEAAFAGVEAIVHAGDVGGAPVLDALREIAPLHAVYGNNDEPLGGGLGLRLHEDFELAGVPFHLVHQLPHARPGEGARVVVFGHSHRTLIERRGEVLYLNPGAAGRVGFHRVQTVALLTAHAGQIEDARIVELGARLLAGETSGDAEGPPMNDALLDELDAEAERFSESIEREQYLNGSGQKDELDLQPIYDAHARLFSRETIADLQRADQSDERYPELRRLAVEGYLDAAANHLTEEIALRETKDAVEWDGDAVPYRSVAPMVRNEPDRTRRHRLERRLVEATAAQNPLRERRWDVLHAKAQELGYASYRALVEDVGRLDVAGLATTVRGFLRDTEAHYRSELARRLRAIDIDPALAEKSDLAFLFREPEFDRWFPAERLVQVYTDTMRGLGLTGEAQERITLDVENRPTKSPRAFCSALRIPDEIYLVISPQGGEYDYGAMFHEGGHSQHFAHVDASLPFALRGLGDNSVTEGFAFVLEHIMAIPGWLERRLGFTDQAAYLAAQRFNRLYMFRRYAAKLLYETELHGRDDVRGSQKRYADLLTAATGARYAPEDYLFDVDDAYYCARYLRAWIFDAQLRALLRDRFGDGWFAQPAAGAKLIELWSHGQRYDAPELLRREGLGGLDAAAIAAELSA